jgi:hypothetical protein
MNSWLENRVYADAAYADPSDPGHVTLERIAFLETDKGEWIRYGTARLVDMRFDRSAPEPRVSGRMQAVSFFDRRMGRFVWSAGDKKMTLQSDGFQCVVSSAALNRLPRDSGLELTDVVIEEDHQGRRRTCLAARAIVEVARADSIDNIGVRIDAYDAKVTRDSQTVTRANESLGPISIPVALRKELEQTPIDTLLAARPQTAPDDTIAAAQAEALRKRGDVVRRISAIINERAAFSASVLVLVILGAALGVVFRGSHMIIAFGVSFLPSVLVIVAIVMGRQLAQNAATHLLGLTVMWSGIGAVALLDVWTLFRVIRR